MAQTYFVTVWDGGEDVSLGLMTHADKRWWYATPLMHTGWALTRRAATDALLADSDAGAERERTDMDEGRENEAVDLLATRP